MRPCPRCQRPVVYMTPQCGHCGLMFVGADPGHDAGVRMLIPVGRTALSIVAGYVGVAALVVFPLAPVAIVLGILAIRDLRKQPGKHGLGRAVFAIVAGALVTLVVAAVALLA